MEPGQWIEAKIARMVELRDADDTEYAHAEADSILVEVLRNLGLHKLTAICDAYEHDGFDKWYA